MKTKITILLFLCTLLAAAQSKEQTMEARAKALHKALDANDKAQWKQFMQENYTKALIERPMRAQVAESDGATKKEDKPADPLEAKLGMFARLHDDFGGGKLSSLKVEGNQVRMVITSTRGDNGTFMLRFTAAAPYLIDGLGIEVGEITR